MKSIIEREATFSITYPKEKERLKDKSQASSI